MAKKTLLLILITMMALPIMTHAQDDDMEREIFESEDENFTFEHPAEWLVNELSAAFIITNSEAIMDSIIEGEDPPEPESGDLVMTLLIMPSDFLPLLGIEGETLDELAMSLLDFTSAEADTITTEPDIITIIAEDDDNLTYDIGYLTFVSSEGDDGMLAIYRINDDITGIAIVAAVLDELEQHQATIYDMLISANYDGTVDDLIATLSQ